MAKYLQSFPKRIELHFKFLTERPDRWKICDFDEKELFLGTYQ
jgi:hypothetical protein